MICLQTYWLPLPFAVSYRLLEICSLFFSFTGGLFDCLFEANTSREYAHRGSAMNLLGKFQYTYRNSRRLTWQPAHGFLFVGALLSEPQVVEPLDHFDLQVSRYSSHPHVRLDGVQFGCMETQRGEKKPLVKLLEKCNNQQLRADAADRP